MQHLREILRQKLALGRSHRQVARALGISPSTVSVVAADARGLGLDAAAVEALTDAELEARLYPKTPPSCVRPEPDCAMLHLELRRPGVTLALLHFEFLGTHPDGLRYTAFCERYRAWTKRQSLVMRQVHVAGDKLFVDYAGMKPRIVDATTGEIIEVELFVAVLGASNYTFAEATRTQQVPDFVASIARALTFLDQVGPHTRALCEIILRERRHPEWGYRSCLGLFRLAKKYGNERLDAACRRALYAGARSYRPVLTILQHNLDGQPLPEPEAPARVGAHHENMRGPGYYH